MGSQPPQADITLYTNHTCPFAHRAHITLTELGLPFKEEIIDLNTPRSPEYLQINPRGVVPSINYNGEIITDSAIVAQFLVDSYPNSLLPASSDRNGPLTRARVAFFADTYSNKIQAHVGKAIFMSKTEDEVNQAADGVVAGIVKEVEPLLKNAAPYFDGSDKLTFAEVLTAPLVIRLLSFTKRGVLPTNLLSRLEKEAPSFYKWAHTISKHPSVLKIYDEDRVVEGIKRKRAQLLSKA
ncbi:glutathione S-transferase [Fusarium mundagurra]|uniref:Glutathione S-transferase n=1 Tax=Fusarium mundagurra TaxID=1567541 RepID=A0A8H5YRQ2_9HYPO|nr:glutathione S-transferase [Fusarium mundagurra]